jgi:hypothetical protein
VRVLEPYEEWVTFSLPQQALSDPTKAVLFYLGSSAAYRLLQGLPHPKPMGAGAAENIQCLLDEEHVPSVPAEDPQEALLTPAPSAVAKAAKRARKALAAPKDETQMENLEGEAPTPTPEPEPVPAVVPAPPDLLQQFKDVLAQGRELAYQLGLRRPDLDGPLGSFIAINAVIQEAK